MGKKTNFFFFFTKRPIKLYGNLQGNVTQLPKKQIVCHEGKLEIKEKSRSSEWRRGMRTKSPPRIRPSGTDVPPNTLRGLPPGNQL